MGKKTLCILFGILALWLMAAGTVAPLHARQQSLHGHLSYKKTGLAQSGNLSVIDLDDDNDAPETLYTPVFFTIAILTALLYRHVSITHFAKAGGHTRFLLPKRYLLLRTFRI